MRKVWVDSATGGRVTFQFSYAAGNNNGTMIINFTAQLFFTTLSSGEMQ